MFGARCRGLNMAKIADVLLTELERDELARLLAQEINDTVSKRKARLLRAILNKLGHAVLVERGPGRPIVRLP